MFFRGFKIFICFFLLAIQYANAEETPRNELDQSHIYVIGTTPLSSVGTDIDKYAGNVQSVLAEDIENAHAVDLSEILIRRIGSINVNTSQGNPRQNDVFYRGFLASPLAGSAVGLSVYMDGARINEGFGDTVNWDLIPQSAISAITVIPGSNPLFGLNTLGGALTLQTKSGRMFQGTELEGSGGAWGRLDAQLEHGGYHGEYDWYLLADVGEEDGWRVRSPSKTRQVFAKLGWENNFADLDLSYIYNDNDLIGNGFAPESLLAIDREAVHTFPDNTINELHHFNLQGSYGLDDLWDLSGNVFYRNYERSTLNGDAETECEAVFVDNMQEDLLAPALCFGTVADALARTRITELFDDRGSVLSGVTPLELEAGGELRDSLTETDTYGVTLQMNFIGDLFGLGNQLLFGIDHSRIDSQFIQTETEADLQRFGNSVGTVNPAMRELAVNVKTEQEALGLYVSNALDLNDQITMTLAGRWQDVNIEISDQTGEPENADLNGEHDFDRFSPAISMTYQSNPKTTLFINYSEGFRVPTAAELTCADPDDPCNLPNAFVADPPLDPVIARTVELGVRGQLDLGDGLFWDAALYRTRLHDDLLFTVTEAGGGGFFRNIGRTLRDGLELGISGQHNQFVYFANYSYIDASFDSQVVLASVVDPDGVQVRAGNKIPGIPEHTFKLGMDYQLLSSLWIGGNMISVAGTHLRGDEGNALPETGSYTVFNLSAKFQAHQHLELWAKLDNVFDREYETAGARNFNANADIISGSDIAEERFVAPGAPRAGWLGISIKF